MNGSLKITVLSDNTVAAPPVRGEHGLAFWIEIGANRVLFDTGQGLVLADNAQALGVDLGAVDTIVLSHGHYDHTGGLADVLRAAAWSVTVHAHPEALAPKYKRNATGVRYIGIPLGIRETLMAGRNRPVLSQASLEVVPGIRTTGEIPRQHPEEAITEPFCRDPEGRLPDPLLDDQALILDTAPGTVVLLGCAHAGVINTLDHVQQLTAEKPIHAVIGGMHLGSATPERIEWTVQELRRFKIELLIPLHCTGQQATVALWTAFPGACRAGGAGTVFEF